MSETDKEIQQELIKILEQIIQNGVWSGSLFLDACGKKFKELHQRLQEDFGIDAAGIEPTADISPAIAADKIEVFILLYQADGMNIKKWESLLNSITVSSLGRPIYQKQQDVEAVMRLKGFSNNEGYATLLLEKADILKNAIMQPTQDRMGHELVPIKEGAIKPANIKTFTHNTGQYQLTQGNLIKVT